MSYNDDTIEGSIFVHDLEIVPLYSKMANNLNLNILGHNA
jgi:hypothetical protein